MTAAPLQLAANRYTCGARPAPANRARTALIEPLMAHTTVPD